MTEPVLVAGGGIGGLAVARALARRDVPVVVFERAERPVPERGTGLTLWGNAMRVLADLDCAEAVAKSGGLVRQNLILSAKGALLFDSPVGEISDRVGAPASYVVRRVDLLAALYGEGRDVEVRTGCEAVGYREDADGVVLRLSDGEEVRGRALIAADGARSVLRDQLIGDGEAIPVGAPIWRGISTGNPGLVEGTALLVWGPAGGGIGGGKLAGEHVSWTISVNAEHQRKLEAAKNPKPVLREFVRGLHGQLEQALEMTDDDDIISAQVRIRKPADKWVSRRVAVLGDAAHALPTGFGQGACMALEDAFVLANCLRSMEVPNALAEYDRVRQERLSWLRPKIMFIDKFARIENRLVCAARDFLVQRLPVGKNPETWERILSFPT